ncbi:MAG: hypothetical protein LBI62_04630 [Candidatus Accumulibacter sp.]|jgi:hypothetical protein|nr:hypothetical protein [Accumulibacter sp.]
MLSLRTIFRWMLLIWFIAVGLLAVFLGDRMENRQAGDLVTRIFTEPAPSPATPILEHEPPGPAEATPAETKTDDWMPMPNGRAPGKGRIGAPQFTTLPDGSLEIRLPYQGSLGGETHFVPREAGTNARLDALSVDLHGAWEFLRQTDAHVGKSVVCRVQIYSHPEYVRVSAIACTPKDDTHALAVQVLFSSEQIRFLFSSVKG